MGMVSVTYTILPTSEVQVEVDGVEGKDCIALTKEVLEKLGEVKKVEYKSEYYRQSTVQKNSSHTSSDIHKPRW